MWVLVYSNRAHIYGRVYFNAHLIAEYSILIFDSPYLLKKYTTAIIMFIGIFAFK